MFQNFLVFMTLRLYLGLIFRVSASPQVILDQSAELHSNDELQHEISNNVACATSKGSDQPAHTV